MVKAVCVLNGESVKGVIKFQQDVSFLLKKKYKFIVKS
jgi:hypothetical protein